MFNWMLYRPVDALELNIQLDTKADRLANDMLA